MPAKAYFAGLGSKKVKNKMFFLAWYVVKVLELLLHTRQAREYCRARPKNVYRVFYVSWDGFDLYGQFKTSGTRGCEWFAVDTWTACVDLPFKDKTGSSAHLLAYTSTWECRPWLPLRNTKDGTPHRTWGCTAPTASLKNSHNPL